jgi:hypothetical protein
MGDAHECALGCGTGGKLRAALGRRWRSEVEGETDGYQMPVQAGLGAWGVEFGAYQRSEGGRAQAARVGERIVVLLQEVVGECYEIVFPCPIRLYYYLGGERPIGTGRVSVEIATVEATGLAERQLVHAETFQMASCKRGKAISIPRTLHRHYGDHTAPRLRKCERAVKAYEPLAPKR